MVRDSKLLAQFERQLCASTPIDIERNFLLASALLEEARALGVFPSKEPLAGLDNKIRMVRILNGLSVTARQSHEPHSPGAF